MMDAENMNMVNRKVIEKRTKDFALRIIKLVSVLPQNQVGYVLGRQLLKSGTSIGANYHEANHASSRKHFISTMEIAQREAAETSYWLGLLTEAEIMPKNRLIPLIQE